jgi:hypothetical protein
MRNQLFDPFGKLEFLDASLLREASGSRSRGRMNDDLNDAQ